MPCGERWCERNSTRLLFINSYCRNKLSHITCGCVSGITMNVYCLKWCSEFINIPAEYVAFGLTTTPSVYSTFRTHPVYVKPTIFDDMCNRHVLCDACIYTCIRYICFEFSGLSCDVEEIPYCPYSSVTDVTDASTLWHILSFNFQSHEWSFVFHILKFLWCLDVMSFSLLTLVYNASVQDN
jgi:hypothetical protein